MSRYEARMPSARRARRCWIPPAYRVLPDCRQRFADVCPELACQLENVQDIFLPRCLNLLLVEQITGCAIPARAGRARACRGSRSILRQPRCSRCARMSRATSSVMAPLAPPHQLQCSTDAVVGDDARSSATARACRESCRGLIDTGRPPVVLMKSASTMVSLSVSVGGRRR